MQIDAKFTSELTAIQIVAVIGPKGSDDGEERKSEDCDTDTIRMKYFLLNRAPVGRIIREKGGKLRNIRESFSWSWALPFGAKS